MGRNQRLTKLVTHLGQCWVDLVCYIDRVYLMWEYVRMRDTKLLQTLIDGQVKLQEQVKEGFRQVNERLDKIGSDVAQLQDDLPAGRQVFQQLKSLTN